jgi:hypothetical protein
MSEPRSFVDHVADALDNAPRYVRDILTDLGERNRERARRGEPMLDENGHPISPGRTLGDLLSRG